MLLVGDIGGTKTVLHLYSPASGPRAALVELVFRSADYPDLESLLREFLSRAREAPAVADAELRVDRAILAVAGPVIGGRARITNLPWLIDALKIGRELGLGSVTLLNDLEATAWSVPFLQAEDLVTLNAGHPEPQGARAVVAPGTGLGQAYLTWNGAEYVSHCSEGGHVDFGPTSAEERELLAFLGERFEHVSYERLCSGIGLPNLYAFHKEVRHLEEPGWLSESLAAATDPTPVIVQAALDSARSCSLCQATLHTFVSILGACAGNLALTVLSTGGLYLGGGIPPRIVPLLRGEPFMAAFRAKGRMRDLLARVPVHVILDPRSSLLGMSIRGLA